MSFDVYYIFTIKDIQLLTSLPDEDFLPKWKITQTESTPVFIPYWRPISAYNSGYSSLAMNIGAYTPQRTAIALSLNLT